MAETDRFAAQQVEAALLTSSLWHELVYLERVGSTNDVAKELASQGAPTGTVVIADEQTAGRGRLGRRWTAPRGTCLLCSLLLRPDLQPVQIHRLTMLCSMAAADTIARLANLQVALKWPNDLVIEDQGVGAESPPWRKLAGTLTETGVIQGDLSFVVVGIGINVNVPLGALHELAPNATSILAETGRAVSRSALLTALLEAVEDRYERLTAGENPREEWSSRLATLGRHIEVITTEETLDGVAEAVDDNGALLLRTPAGALRRVVAGDVTVSQS